jgi:MFS family permease
LLAQIPRAPRHFTAATVERMSLSDPAPASLLRHQPFVRFLSARVCATTATQMQAVAIGWQMYGLTHNPLDLGLVGLAQFLPAIALFLVAGHVADRYDRRTVLRICQGVGAAAMAMLALATYGGWITREVIFTVAGVLGAARAFESPTQSSLLPAVVQADLFPRAVAASASASQFATIGGPALGGLIYAVNPVAAYAVAGMLLLVASVTSGLIQIERAPVRREPFSFQSLFAGFAFMRKTPIVLGAIALDLFAVLLGGATALLPVFARDILITDAEGLGLLRACPAVGAVTISLVLMRWPLRARVGRVMYAAVAVFGIATIVFALSRSLVVSMAALAVLGGADLVSVVIRSTLVQLQTPDAMRGRVSAVNSMFIGTSNQLGEFRAGVMAHWFGTVPAVLIGGIGTLIVVALWTRLFPQLFDADAMGRPQPPPP